MRQFLKQFLPVVLSHASDNADNDMFASAFKFFHVHDFSQSLAFGLFTHTACIENKQIGIIFVLVYPPASGG